MYPKPEWRPYLLLLGMGLVMDRHGPVTSLHCRLPRGHYTNLCIVDNWGTSPGNERTAQEGTRGSGQSNASCVDWPWLGQLSGLNAPQWDFPVITSLASFWNSESQGFRTWIIMDQSQSTKIQVRICSEHGNFQGKTFTSNSLNWPCHNSASVSLIAEISLNR